MAVAAMVLGIIGLVMCFLFLFSILAIIFGLIATRRIRQSNGAVTGLGKARAGWILGIVGLVIGGLLVALSATGALDDDVEVGMCADVSNLEGEVSSVPVVDCDEPHDAEVTATGELNPGGGGEYPGEGRVRQLVGEECSGQSFSDYVGVAYLDSELDVNFVFPNERNWTEADGSYICFAFLPDGTELTSSVRGSNR
jgi:hypothetical protein